MKPMKILILSANTGSGHNSTARAIGEQLTKMNIEYEIADTLSFISERVSDFISWGHSYVYRKLPKLFGIGYCFEEKHPPRFLYKQCARGAEALHAKLEAEPFDAVICVHVFSGMMMTEVRNRYQNRIPLYFVSTDYTCSPGVSEISADGYFIPHRMLLGEFVRNGAIAADKLFATGIPVASSFCETEDQGEARRVLGLPEEGKIVLLSCGSMGAGKLEKSARMLPRYLPEDATLVVLCGLNEKLYEQLKPYENEHLRIIGFTEQISTYMSTADLYITKPGGLTTSEAIAKRLPMIFINAVPGCELRNFEFLISNGVAGGAKKWKQVALMMQKSFRDPTIFAQQVEVMKSFVTHNAAEQICRHIVSDLRKQ
ncbi:MAG: hypothetical protein IKJ35_03715 [Clostridia bacterium]|nr:hypothetical protein [Clostridia bacterium]